VFREAKYRALLARDAHHGIMHSRQHTEHAPQPHREVRVASRVVGKSAGPGIPLDKACKDLEGVTTSISLLRTGFHSTAMIPTILYNRNFRVAHAVPLISSRRHHVFDYRAPAVYSANKNPWPKNLQKRFSCGEDTEFTGKGS
jgi:hypothetical protein